MDFANIKPAALLLGIGEEELRKKICPDTSAKDNTPKHRLALFSAPQVQEDLCVSYATLRRAIKNKELRPTQIGRRLLFHPADIEDFLNSKRGLKKRAK